MENYLQVQNINCTYYKKKVFSHLSFSIFPGEVLIIEGVNGAGKTSLLRMVAGLLTPAFGNIFYAKQNISTLGINYFSRLHYIGHKCGLKLGLTVRENLELAAKLFMHDVKDDVNQVLMQLQLIKLAKNLVSDLSAGQKRKLSLAKLILFSKPIWILDEPLAALDHDTQQLFLNLLSKHIKENGICIISSHQDLKVHAAKKIKLKIC